MTHAQALEQRLVRLTIFVAVPVPGVLVRRDGQLVSQAEVSVAMPVDPGEHIIEARAEGHETWKHTVRVGDTPTTSL